MDVIEIVYDEITGFLGISKVLELLGTGDYGVFRTYDGIVSLIMPIIPLLVLLELIQGLIYKKPHTKIYKMNFAIYIVNRIIGRFISIAMIGLIIAWLQPWAPFQTSFTWYWFIYGYIVWEFGHYLYHYWGHKVRLFWCFHATHHAPEDMNLTVSYAHFFLEGPYADTIRTTVCILLGVQPELLFLIMFIDGTWGAFIHIGEHLMKDARFGVLGKYILTPSHHRVHHARNPLYIDTNFCNLLNIWDRIFGTYQEEQRDMEISYGVTRDIDTSNFVDVYFGEIIALAKDVARAPGLGNKIKYLFMPPGWHHDGNHQTAKILRNGYLNREAVPAKANTYGPKNRLVKK